MRNSKTSFRPIRTQKLSYTDTAAQSASAIGSGVTRVRLMATTLAHVVISVTDSATDATTSDMPLSPYVPEYIDVAGGEYISAIRNTTSGDLYITEVG